MVKIVTAAAVNFQGFYRMGDLIVKIVRASINQIVTIVTGLQLIVLIVTGYSLIVPIVTGLLQRGSCSAMFGATRGGSCRLLLWTCTGRSSS